MSTIWNFFASLFYSKQSDFEKYVSVILDEQSYLPADVIEIIIQETKFKQRFAFIICSKEKGKYTVLLILDEFHRNKLIIKRQKNTPQGPVIENKTFSSQEDAKGYVSKKCALYRIGAFTELEQSYYRVVKCDKQCLQNPDAHLLPGDYILRDLAAFSFGASHSGVYVGRGKVLHYDDPDQSASVVHCLTGKGGHIVHVAPLSKFVSSEDQEIRILVHCFQQRTPEEKIQAAEELSNVKYGQYEYGLFSNNCQHLASLVSCGRLEMVDQEIIDSLQKFGYLALGVVLAWSAKAVYDAFFGKAEEDERNNPQKS